MKKFVSLLLVAVLLTAIAAPALALTGTVNGPLRMRKSTSTKSTILGWLENGRQVTVEPAGTGWYSCNDYVWQHSNCTGWLRYKEGYVMQKFIK